MTQTCPIDIAREIERRWERRSHVAASRVAQNNNHAGDGICPICKEYASIGPRGFPNIAAKELIRRHWLCRACGHEWITVLHVLA